MLTINLLRLPAPRARFRFYQEMELGAPPVPQYDLLGGAAHGSTVGASTLARLGVPVPTTPPYDAAAQQAQRAYAQAQIDQVFNRR